MVDYFKNALKKQVSIMEEVSSAKNEFQQDAIKTPVSLLTDDNRIRH